MTASRILQSLLGTGFFLTSLACIGADAAADETHPEYAIEIVIFQYLNPDNGGETYTSSGDEPDFSRIRSLASIPDLVPLGPDELRLGGEAYTFRRGANYRLLLHEGWHQTLADRGNAEAMYVRYPEATKRKTLATIPGLSFMQSGEEAPVMEGTIQVALERYLHLTVDLVYRPDPSSPSTTYQSDVYVDPDSPYDDIAVSSPAYRLKETRRMRSGETHYLDHPEIGVIALIRQYVSPKVDVPADNKPESPPPATTSEPTQ